MVAKRHRFSQRELTDEELDHATGDEDVESYFNIMYETHDFGRQF